MDAGKIIEDCTKDEFFGTHALRARAAVPLEDPAPLNKNSLFAVLLRSPWWVSMPVAAGIFALAKSLLLRGPCALRDLRRAAVPRHRLRGRLEAAARPQRGAHRRHARIAARACPGRNFPPRSKTAFRRDGYAVSRLNIAGADLELTKSGRVSLVACKRWKVARAGVEPLRELDAAREAREAHEGIYVAAGDITDNARAYAAERKFRLLHGAELANFCRHPNPQAR